MFSASTKARLRTWLILGRVSNLPTVWSNCVAGWLLGGGGSIRRLLLAIFGGSFLYIGGMFLNDAFDADFDRQHRKERPIPSGQLSEHEVWLGGAGWMVLGALLLMPLGRTTGLLTLALIATILIYDWIHKAITFSPIIMAACRFLLLLLAASVGKVGIEGLALWSAIALFCYIVGLSYIAKTESTRGVIGYWPRVLLAIPPLLALLVNVGRYRIAAIFFTALFVCWAVRCLQFIFWGHGRNVGMTVSGLLAGIVLVDLLAVCTLSPGLFVLFALFFGTALYLQRSIPAT